MLNLNDQCPEIKSTTQKINGIALCNDTQKFLGTVFINLM